MKSERKKRKLSVRFSPLSENGVFDIKPPDKIITGHQQEKIRKSGDWWRFFFAAFVIFALFTFIGVYTNGREFLSENKDAAYTGYSSLASGVKSLAGQDFEKADVLFKDAEASFQQVDKNMGFLTTQANGYMNSPLYLDAARKLLDSGVSMSKIGEDITSILKDVRALPHAFMSQNLGDKNVKITDLINTQKTRLENVIKDTIKVQNNLTTINSAVLPKDLKDSIKKAQDGIGTMIAALNEVDKDVNTTLKLLGYKMPHSYLILLQNNHELRATGGFIGSYALVDMNDGAITKMDAKDIYQTDGQLKDIVPAPPGIDKVADRLYMRDANYSPDFPTSAKQIMWFLEHSAGPSVDTVIAIDQTVAEELLGLTGPVQLKDFPFNIDANNFNDVFSYYIESKLSNTANPKQLLIDFLPVIKNKLFAMKDLSKAGGALSSLINGKHIQVYSTDDDVESLVQNLHIDGSIIAPSSNIDYLSIITTAIGGNKSDAYIKTDLSHKTEVGPMGEITDDVSITKTDTWQESDFANWKKLIDLYGAGKVGEDTLRFIQGAGDNKDYMRVYVPKGSLLVSIEGVDLKDLNTSDDLGYTVFGFPFGAISAGKNKTVQIIYKLPFSLDTDKPMSVYRFIAQNQAGAQNVTLKKSIETPSNLKILDTYPKTELSAFTIYPQYTSALDQNRIFLSAIGK
jgi:hypothetical protein